MANGVKTYSIKINGIDTSIDAVKSLEKELFNLEQRIEALGKQTVNVKSSGGGGGTSTSSKSALSEEEKLAKQIEQIDAKREAYSKEIYQNYLAAKEVLNETVKDQKQLAASERLQAGAYSNTMQGMKQELADIKAVMQTVDLGDTAEFDKLTQRANELNEALKKIEESYGQFGRNVGNYPDAAKSMQQIVVTINGVERQFSSAREATKTLNNELKAMAFNGKQNTKEYEELRQKLLELESTMNDAKKPMDGLMDTMESFTAIASMSKGFGAFFGVDSTEIQRSMQQLLALQTALKGLQTISKQVETREGIGKWIAPFNTNINAATNRLLVFNRALLGTGKAAKVASVAIKGIGVALKAVFSAGLLIAVNYLVDEVMKLVESFKKVDKEAEIVKETEQEVSKAYANATATLTKYQAKVNSFNGDKKQEKKLVEELNSALGDSLGTYDSLAKWMDVLTKKGGDYIKMLTLQAKAQANFNNYVKAMQEKDEAFEKSTADYENLFTKMLPGSWTEKWRNKQRVAAIQAADARVKASEEALVNSEKEIEKFMETHGIGTYATTIEKNGKKTKSTVNEIEKEIAQARIAAMKEGLNKTITQLEEERKQRLAKLDKNMKNYKSYELQINNIYNQRILEATQEWNIKMQKTYSDMWQSINQDALSNLKEQYELIKRYYEQSGQTLNNMDIGSPTTSYLNKNVVPSYGMLTSKSLSSDSRKAANLTATFDASKFGEDMRKYVDLQRQASVSMEEYLAKYNELQDKLRETSSAENDAILGQLTLELAEIHKNHEKIIKDYHNFGIYINTTYDETEVRLRENLLYQEAYSEKLSVLFKQRNANIEYEQRQADARLEDELEATTKKRKEIADKSYENEAKAAKKKWNQMSEMANSAYTEELSGLRAQLDEGLLTTEKYNKLKNDVETNHEKRKQEILKNWQTAEKNLETKHEQELIQIDQDANQKRQDNNKKSFETQLQELRDFQTAIVNIESKQPVLNALGITNFTETNKNNRNILDSYQTMIKKINQMRSKLNEKKNQGLIDEEMYSSTLRELDNLSQGIGEKMDEIKQKLSVGEQIGQFISDIQQYVQALGQGLQQIMSALWSAEDAAFDRKQEALDKENEMIENKLSEQEDIINQHKDRVNSIEDELQSARGDRRQHLIDQLNAEIAAERAAQKEKEKAAKQKEALDRKQEALDKKRKEAQYNRDLQSIIVSGALAAANAYATKPFIPVGLAMGSLAIALTAAQYAIAKSAKPYAHGGQLDGGVADGPRHSQGGIKVLGGRAEIEGGEFITNRTSTAKNIDLLEYVNSQKRKVDINDLIDFYSSGKPKKTVQSIRGRFAEGGNLPTLRTDIDINDRLVSAFEDYSNRPVVVTVKDINDRQEAVRNVQVLAGLTA